MAKACYIESVDSLTFGEIKLRFRHYQHLDHQGPERRLLLLHGAGVAGRDTWETLQKFLVGWSDILVPDLRGAGESVSLDGKEHPFTVQDLVNDVHHLIDFKRWQTFDLAGYSLGGLVAMSLKQQLRDRVHKQYLLECALLDRFDWHESVNIRQAYSAATRSLRANDAETGVIQFLDTISPNRKINQAVEKLTVARLAFRADGFANALDAVTHACSDIDREALLAAQGDVSSFIGGLSVEPIHHLHRHLADRLPNWHYFLVKGTDHSLPFQKPRHIARIMSDELARFISR